jgi:hypothetical protein
MPTDNEKLVDKVVDRFLGRPATLTIEIHATQDDEDHVRFASFITQLEALKDVLRHTERLMYGTEGNVYYRIAHLKQESPPEVTIEAIGASPRTAEFGAAIFDNVIERLQTLAVVGPDWVPGDMDLPALVAFHTFAPTSSRHIAQLLVRNGAGSITLDEEFGNQVRTAIGPDDISHGEIVGSLEVVNLHNRPRFEVYPTLGGKVTCRFPPDRRRDVVAAVDQYVRVTGRLHYKTWSTHPHAVDLEDIEILAEDASIAALDMLRGSEPTLTDESLKAARNALW